MLYFYSSFFCKKYYFSKLFFPTPHVTRQQLFGTEIIQQNEGRKEGKKEGKKERKKERKKSD